jgi:hypothetical protein
MLSVLQFMVCLSVHWKVHPDLYRYSEPVSWSHLVLTDVRHLDPIHNRGPSNYQGDTMPIHQSHFSSRNRFL